MPASEKKIRGFRWDGGTIKVLELLFDLAILIFCFNFAVFIEGIFKGGDVLAIVKKMIEFIGEDYVFSTFDEHVDSLIHFMHTIGNSMVFIIVYIVMSRVFECTIQKKDKISILKSVFLAVIFTNIALIFIGMFLPILGEKLEIHTYFYAMSAQIFIIGVLKIFEVKFIRKKLRLDTIVIGPKKSANFLFKKIYDDKNTRARVKYIIYTENIIVDELIEYLSKCERVYLSDDISSEDKNFIIDLCLAKLNIDVVLEPKIYEINMLNTKPVVVGDKLTYNIVPLAISIEQRFIKRTLDLLFSVVGIIVSLPIMLLIAILIKIEDKGPVIYKQERITKNNKVFNIYKFRSMIVDAEANTGAIIAKKRDSRITRVGVFIRKTRLDELPQLFNVFKSEMSIVGPRPERRPIIDEVIKENNDFHYRVNVKAGITGYAHIFGKYSTNHRDRLKMDLLYIKKQNLFFDIKIIMYTILTIISSDSSEGIDFDDNNNFSNKILEKVDGVKSEIYLIDLGR